MPHFIDDLPWQQALERLASQPTVNIEGLVARLYRPRRQNHSARPRQWQARPAPRAQPDPRRSGAKFRAHLDTRGFRDVEVNVTGGYDPNETDENSRIVQAELAVCRNLGIEAGLNPRSAGSWPGSVFTAPPLSLSAAQFGLGHGSGAHAPDEYFVIDSTNPRVLGLTGVTMAYLDFLYEMAR